MHTYEEIWFDLIINLEIGDCCSASWVIHKVCEKTVTFRMHIHFNMFYLFEAFIDLLHCNFEQHFAYISSFKPVLL